MLATRHNLAFFGDLVRRAGRAIAEGKFAAFKRSFLERYGAQG
jgi:tRNA-guanine family transglycosylase